LRKAQLDLAVGKGKVAVILIVLVVIGTPFLLGITSIPTHFDDIDDAFIDIIQFWIDLPQLILKPTAPEEIAPEAKPTEPTQPKTTKPPQYVSLRVDVSVSDGTWSRNPTTDLPTYNVRVSYVVSNHGTKYASDVRILVKVGGQTQRSEEVDIAPNAYYRGQVALQLDYDTAKTLTVTATCEDSTDSDALTINAMLPRAVHDEVAKLFITPNDPVIKAKVKEILSSKPFWISDWKALRDWVGNNIEYEYDSVSHGYKEYWQLPRETLMRGKGDCEDQAILLASMLRACGYGADEVYVVCGIVPDGGHAWVSFKIIDVLGKEIWKTLEPTAGGFIVSDLSDLWADIESLLEKREEYFIFNDVVFEWRG